MFLTSYFLSLVDACFSILNRINLAIDGGVQAVVIAAGGEYGIIDKIISGQSAGTIFFLNTNSTDIPLDTTQESAQETAQTHGIEGIVYPSKNLVENSSIEEIAKEVISAYRDLTSLSEVERNKILIDIANSIKINEDQILRENKLDLDDAQKR